MTSREALHSYREKTKDRAAYERIYFFHAHIYYDVSSADGTSKMQDIMKSLQHDFDSDDHVEIHTLQVRGQHGGSEAHIITVPRLPCHGEAFKQASNCDEHMFLRRFKVAVRHLQCCAGQGCRTPSKGQFGGPIHQGALHSHVELPGFCAANQL